MSRAAPSKIVYGISCPTIATEQFWGVKPSEDEEVDEEDVYAEYERISKENQRKINEREEKIEKAEKKVRELNYRFADWYYVISEDVFKKIHLTRSDIIKLTDEAKESGDGIDAFNKLKEQGLNLEAPLSDE